MTTTMHLFLLVLIMLFRLQRSLVFSESFDLQFPPYSQGVILAKDIPDMQSYSICFWLRQTFPVGVLKYAAVFSYSNSLYPQIAIGFETKETGATVVWDGKEVLFPSIPFKDEKWHHICIAWNQEESSFGFYKEGGVDILIPIRFRKEKGLKGGGPLVIGARRDPSGGYTKHFNGSISNFNIWNRAHSKDEIRKIYDGCEAYRGNVLPWCQDVIVPLIKQDIYTTSPSTACDSSYADAIFTREINKKFKGHVVSKTTVYDELSCALSCLRTCMCRSFNAWKKRNNQYHCELNSATSQQYPRDLWDIKGVAYYSV